jgi:Raf kinase inhibitor-like YbhB/YbcL family protein
MRSTAPDLENLMRPLATLTLLLGLATVPAMAAPFTLTSPDIKPGSKIASQSVFNGFGCTGQNVSPALSWSGAPAGTKSFVLTVYDPDAPTGSGFWHWVMYNIPVGTSSLAQGAGTPGKEPPGAVQATTDYSTPGWGGPCPPPGDKPHRYIFTLYAVKVDKLEVPPNPSDAVIGFVTHFATIGKASFTARYGR